jgi:hypothetical protein
MLKRLRRGLFWVIITNRNGRAVQLESLPVANLVKPVVRLFFPCDEAVLDTTDEKWTLKNPWHTVAMPPGVMKDFCQEEIWLYAQFSGGVGTFYLSVHLLDDTGRVLGKSPPALWELSGGNQVCEEVFHLTKVPFPRPGLYEFI